MQDNNKGSLLFMTIDNLFTNYLRNRVLTNYEIIIVSHDIVSDIRRNGRNNTKFYESKFANIDFCPSLYPNVITLNVLYESTKKDFYKAYKEYLTTHISCISELCDIVDMVVNRNINVILICSDKDWISDFFYVMRDTIQEMFGLYGISYDEFEVDPELLHKYGDEEDIKAHLEYYIIESDSVDKLTGKYINKYVDDKAGILEKVLMNKTDKELREYCESNNIYYNKRKSKEYTVAHILDKIMEDTGWKWM